MRIDIWFLSTVSEDNVLARFAALLTEAERARAGRYRFEADRRHSIISRGALRTLLSRYTGNEIEIVEESGGKPRLRSGEVDFNVSHSGELIAIAIAKIAIGLDIERVRPLGDDAIRIARDSFSAEEFARLAAARDRDQEFFAVWTAKEAVVKASGDGLSANLQSFTVPALSDDFQPVAGVEQWSVRRITAPWGGYRATLAAPTAERFQVHVAPVCTDGRCC